MTAGLFVTNDFGTIQIDENYKNFVLVARGTVATTAFVANASTFSLSFGGCTTPLLAIRHGDFFSCVGFRQPSNGNVTFTGLSAGGAGTVLEYFLFDIPPAYAVPSSGLVIWNGSGEVIFRSDMRPLRIIDVVNGGGPVTRYYDGSRAYAVIEGDQGRGLQAAGRYPYPRSLGRTYSQIIGGTINLGTMRWYTSGINPAPVNWVRPNFSSIIVDVSNY